MVVVGGSQHLHRQTRTANGGARGIEHRQAVHVAQAHPRHARPLDEAVARLDRAIGTLEGRHPDYWHFLTETEAVRQAVAHVVSLIREERGAAGH